MHAVTIKEAKARLNALIDAAQAGEQVVLMRGSKHVAIITPISSDDLELASAITDVQATRLWKQLSAERARGALTTFPSPEAAVTSLKAGRQKPRKRR